MIMVTTRKRSLRALPLWIDWKEQKERMAWAQSRGDAEVV